MGGAIRIPYRPANLSARRRSAEHELVVCTAGSLWAHLGGFIAGVVLGLVLLLSRVFHAGGTDLLSVLLGKRVWALTGRPSDHEKIGFSMPKR